MNVIYMRSIEWCHFHWPTPQYGFKRYDKRL